MDVQARMDLIMMPFLERFNGKPVNEMIRNKLKRLPTEGIDFDNLCRNEMPHYPEFSETVSEMMGWEDDQHVRAFIKVNYRQGGRRKDFCEHLLRELGEDPYGELYSEE